MVTTSTLHGFLDLWPSVLDAGTVVLVDEVAYPVGRVALRAVGAEPVVVRHFDPGHVAAVVGGLSPGTSTALLVDGLCPGCGRRAPRQALARALGGNGTVVVDDTQALGLIGPTTPVRHLPGAAEVVVAAASKGFGVPVAVVAGPRRVIESARRSEGRFHHSGPDAASLVALRQTLADEPGVQRRQTVLSGLVRHFRAAAPRAGLSEPDGGLWPTQTVPVYDRDVTGVVDALACRGVRALPLARRCRPGVGVGFLITVAHTTGMIDTAVAALASVLDVTPAHRETRRSA